jgi:hypothetical protein
VHEAIGNDDVRQKRVISTQFKNALFNLKIILSPESKPNSNYSTIMSKKQAKKIDDSASAAPVVADETSIILSPRSTSSTSMSDTTVGHQQLTRYITAIASAEYDRRSFAFTASMSKALSAGQKLLQVLVKSHKETSKQLAETQESVLQLKVNFDWLIGSDYLFSALLCSRSPMHTNE